MPNYCINVKISIIEDEKKRDKILKLLRFITSNNITGLVSIEDNLGKMKKKINKRIISCVERQYKKLLWIQHSKLS